LASTTLLTCCVFAEELNNKGIYPSVWHGDNSPDPEIPMTPSILVASKMAAVFQKRVEEIFLPEEKDWL
jgi:hypothetical protein